MKRFDPFAPRTEDVDQDHVARALANQCRYGGRTTRYYSVAEHCTHISHAMESDGHELRVVALGHIHDCVEFALQDQSWPLKQRLSITIDDETLSFSEYEDRVFPVVSNALFPGIQFSTDDWNIVKEYDTRILSNEWRALMPFVQYQSEAFFAEEIALDVIIECWNPHRAFNEFRKRLGGLQYRLRQ